MTSPWALKVHKCRFDNLPVSSSSYEHKHADDFTLSNFLLFEICAVEICEMFVYKQSETIEYFKN